MGWKSSLIIVENKEKFKNNNAILKALGKSEYKFDRELTLDECLYPKDKSINIGYFNDNLIITDDFQLTTNSLEKSDGLHLTDEEKNLVQLFPNSEIVTVACLSGVNYHGYSLIVKGIKKRIKLISSDTPKIEFGAKILEEHKIYEKSYSKGSQNYWKHEYNSEEDLTEDQLMEDFTFGVAKRRLGVLINHSDAQELMEQVKFKKYLNINQAIEVTESIKAEKNTKWIKYGIIVMIIIIWQLLKRTVFNS